jgi:hypothetical protein
MSQIAFPDGISRQRRSLDRGNQMHATETEYRRMPGLFRVWDLQFVLDRSTDYQIHFDSLTEDRTPLFAIYRRTAGPEGALQ